MNPQKQIVQQGFQLLQSQKNYKQVNIVRKILTLGYESSTASLSNILRGKDVGTDALWNNSEGVKIIVKKELNFDWIENRFQKSKDINYKAETIEEYIEAKSSLNMPGFSFHENGRLIIDEKVEFFADTQKELIEFGVTLNSFSNYFFTQNEMTFKRPIARLLERGVTVSCYLLESGANKTLMYFEDRAEALEEEKINSEKIKTSIKRLKEVQWDFNQQNYEGKFEIYTYRHIPNNYFFVADGELLSGKMMISHYIYGVTKANCPVMQFTKKDNRTLFRKYWTSLQYLIKGAKPILPDEN